MFTGIVEEYGTIKSVEKKKNLYVLKIKAQKVARGTKIGDSISVDGVCLTVVGAKNGVLTFDLMKETIIKTTFQDRKINDTVNLERSLKADGRLGGHFVQGHVDGMGNMFKKITQKNYVEFRIKVDKKLMPYIVPKGSIAVDGISLTVGDVRKDDFSIYIIPHTLKVTTLGHRKVPCKVDIEVDILAKYIKHLQKFERRSPYSLWKEELS